MLDTSSKSVIIPLSEYMVNRGFTNYEAAKEQAIIDMKIVRTMTIEKEDTNKNIISFIKVADSGTVQENGDIVFVFGRTFFDKACNYFSLSDCKTLLPK